MEDQKSEEQIETQSDLLNTCEVEVAVSSPSSDEKAVKPEDAAAADVASVPPVSDAEVKDEQPCRCMWMSCHIYFPSKWELQNHIVGEHINVDDDPVCMWRGCKRNGRDFQAVYQLVSHLTVHTEVSRIQCWYPNCHRQFQRNEYLRTHLRTHVSDQRYECPVTGCIRLFRTESDRNKHFDRFHCKIKRNTCPIQLCPKRYSDPSSLRKHMIGTHGNITYDLFKVMKDIATNWVDHYRIRLDDGHPEIIDLQGNNMDVMELMRRADLEKSNFANQSRELCITSYDSFDPPR